MPCTADEDTADCQHDCSGDLAGCRSDCNDPDSDPADRRQCQADCNDEFDDCRADCFVCDGTASCGFLTIDGQRVGPVCINPDDTCVPSN